ncbi:MAG: single-stranded-DNA-specific exonuclease RecJ [Meiothermus sp.]
MIWKFRPWPPRAELEPLMSTLGIPPLAAAVLYNRGFRDPQRLDPPLELLPIRGLEEAARRVIGALERGERIRIHGDYDADGLTGTAILLGGLARLGAKVHAFVPHRLQEGYGVLMDRVPEHLEACDLFITVDCGISNHAELRSLVEHGISVLVTDHHSPGETPPPGLIVHPALTPELSGLPHPTGAGVAYLLLWKVRELLGLEAPLEFADLAAVGTIADVAPLLGFNRALVKEGLRQLRHSAHLGLRELAQQHCKDYTAAEVAFRIAPRINAASRLGQAELALETLTTRDPLSVRSLCEALNTLNARRQKVEEEMLKRVLPTLDPAALAYVIHDPEGHAGVMGIVASRILERFYRPVFIIAEGKGSVRSTPGISAVGALRAAAGLLKRFGGHAQAAGFAIAEENIPAFREAIYRYVAQHPEPVPEVYLDGSLSGEDFAELYEALQFLEPLGQENPEPLFYLRGKPERVATMGEGRHLRFYLDGVKVVRWKDSGENLPQTEVELAASLTLNEWQGERALELRALAYRAPQMLDDAGWAKPVPFGSTLSEVLEAKGPVYVAPQGVAWFTARGVPVVAPEEAEVWFSLPERAATPRSGSVRVALSDRALAALVPPVGQTQFGQVLRAWEQGQAPPEPWATVFDELGRWPGSPGVNLYASATYRRLSLRAALGRRLATACQVRSAGMFSEALERWWELPAREGERVPATP